MNRRVLVIGSVVLVAGVAVAVYAAVGRTAHPRHPHPAASSSHSTGMDQSMAAVIALYKAPEGATPCESAYNAFKASQDLATNEGATPIVLRLSPRDEFLARCGALPSTTQECLVPRYAARHRSQCPEPRPPDEVLAGLVQLVAGETTRPPDEPGSP